MGNAADGGVRFRELFLGQALVQERHRLVLFPHIIHHGADIGAKQESRAHQNHADGQHTHGGKGHHFVGLEIVKALTNQIGKT